MAILRVMTYALNSPPEVATGDLAQIIRLQRPELVCLQFLSADQLQELARETGLQSYGGRSSCGFLSCHPITAVQEGLLGSVGNCLRADLNLADKRLHLFNVQLAFDPALRGQQVARLFAEDMLGANLPCATLVSGDFSFPLWGGGQWLLRRRLKRVKHPRWGANYPAEFPLWACDRIYLRGPIHSLAGQVISTPEARKLSRQLPIVTTLELTDTREYLKIPEVAKSRMRPVTG
jgi:endonuclease/exonuclease/phosphatase family metal-dependent hydrolase